MCVCVGVGGWVCLSLSPPLSLSLSSLPPFCPHSKTATKIVSAVAEGDTAARIELEFKTVDAGVFRQRRLHDTLNWVK